MNILLSIILTFVLMLINGYFSMSEMAMVNARHAVLQQEADEGDAKAKRALEVSSDTDKLLATIQVFITLVGFFASAAATATLADPLAKWLSGFGVGWLSAISPVLSVILVTLLVSYVTLVIGELVPKRIALADAEGVAKNVAVPMSRFERAANPIVSVLTHSTNGIAKLLGVKGTEDRQEVSEDEIKYLVNEQDTLLDEEKRMIHEIFDLGDTIAREVMVPRVDMTLIEDTEDVESTLALMRRTGYSRIPVFHEDHDRVIGIVMTKDLINAVMEEKRDAPVTDFMRSPAFVPDTKDIIPLLEEMQTSHQQMYIVVDEYGGTAGLITIEDIVEEIVGEIEDEFDPDNKYLTRLSDTEWLVDGRFPIDDALEEGFPVAESDEYETMAGWLLDQFDALPRPGDIYENGGYTFKVQTMRRRRIALIRVTAPNPSGKEGDVPAEEDDE